ncbi:site-2 protease family protein [Actimicrobium sp. CCC2.4]|uniref:site-2 protease family protein n=1 Tax=Actimicrobium sp. CCC2.4 TaxID=3048606 RepID=UPI002AC97123|nr:site-2 protease family protein [Actimicrobium sp. CCC2.4]MEB0135185.1 site-2 protease family protein [Actimicrobium sp. CCC2.4]WPX30982.1 site-2 protease family protein [Actimicrobium sp. CCC2.4]
MNDLIQTVAVYALPVLFAITLHEAAHAYAARYFGDNTAYAQGRMTLNPIVHIDPVGTILVPILLYFSTGGAFLFGYAKPVPVDFGRLRNPKRNMRWVAFAGPASNLFMGFVWAMLGIIMAAVGVQEPFFYDMVQAGVMVNLVVFAFNLFPIPPLDGGRVMYSLLPDKIANQYAKLEPYGFFIVLGLALTKILYPIWVLPVMALGRGFLTLLLTPFHFLLN